MRILLISAYEANSHKVWANTLMNGLSQHEWSYLSLPARHFAWRIRGNAMSFAFDPKFKSILEKPFDLVIATSMTDCVGLKAFCPDLQNIPWLLYFHENQFAYPASANQQGLVEMQMVTLYSALAANVCVFNSRFNKETFFDGARGLLNKLPDYVSSDWLSTTEAKSKVLPVPLELLMQERRHLNPPSNIVRLVWSARWEFDKGPDRLLAALQELERRSIDYNIAILGEQFRHVPEEFDWIKNQFSHRIIQFGFAENREDYFAFLANSDFILSTALHEFQGLSVLEAVSLGCIPILPNRQVYPELFSDEFLYAENLKDISQEANNAVDLIQALIQKKAKTPEVGDYQAKKLLTQYNALIEEYGS